MRLEFCGTNSGGQTGGRGPGQRYPAVSVAARLCVTWRGKHPEPQAPGAPPWETRRAFGFPRSADTDCNPRWGPPAGTPRGGAARAPFPLLPLRPQQTRG